MGCVHPDKHPTRPIFLAAGTTIQNRHKKSRQSRKSIVSTCNLTPTHTEHIGETMRDSRRCQIKRFKLRPSPCRPRNQNQKHEKKSKQNLHVKCGKMIKKHAVMFTIATYKSRPISIRQSKIRGQRQQI